MVGFAYGSNMLSRRLRARVPSARMIGIGELPGHVLRWDKHGQDGSGKCDAAFTGRQSDRLWGVVYTLDIDEKPVLDGYEGLHRGYAEKEVEVLTAHGPLSAQIYYATNTDPRLLPFDWYKAFVLAGARENGLPADYIALIASVACIADADGARAALNARILAGG
jgi:hypothetical protein